ncbi:hypothetical protein C8Q78DRAFT_425637 [Trametes maxima]|nr:hypothetical protein C8Q78DRAFT_425637 [Trametes maxima]
MRSARHMPRTHWQKDMKRHSCLRVGLQLVVVRRPRPVHALIRRRSVRATAFSLLLSPPNLEHRYKHSAPRKAIQEGLITVLQGAHQNSRDIVLLVPTAFQRKKHPSPSKKSHPPSRSKRTPLRSQLRVRAFNERSGQCQWGGRRARASNIMGRAPRLCHTGVIGGVYGSSWVRCGVGWRATSLLRGDDLDVGCASLRAVRGRFQRPARSSIRREPCLPVDRTKGINEGGVELSPALSYPCGRWKCCNETYPQDIVQKQSPHTGHRAGGGRGGSVVPSGGGRQWAR